MQTIGYFAGEGGASGTLFGSPAAAHNKYSGKDHNGGKDFLPCEGVHAYANAYGGGYYGLHIAVHAYKGWPYPFLPKWDEEVAYAGCKDYQEAKFPELCSGDGKPFK